MDEILGTLFDKLCLSIKDCHERNPSIDMNDIMRTSVLIQSYIDGLNKPLDKDDPQSFPDMSYEELCKLTRPPRRTPKGYLGPTHSMSHFAEEEDNKRARKVDAIIRYGKNIEKNTKPFFKN
jgi:hypothetical protein